MIRGLSVIQPWATLLATGVKTWETRSWQTPYRGWIAIHASLKPDVPALWDAFDRKYLASTTVRIGAIVGIGRLVDCKRTEDIVDTIVRADRHLGDWTKGRVAWKIEDARPIEAIPCKGKLGLWTLQDAQAEIISLP